MNTPRRRKPNRDDLTIVMDLPGTHKTGQNAARGESRYAAILRSRRIKTMRRQAALLVREQMGAGRPWGWSLARVDFAFELPDDGKKRDLLNYVGALKPAIDGAVDAGLLVDDDARHLLVGRITSRWGDNPHCLICFERLSETGDSNATA